MFQEAEEESGEREGQWVWWREEDPEVKVSFGRNSGLKCILDSLSPKGRGLGSVLSVAQGKTDSLRRESKAKGNIHTSKPLSDD